MPTERVRVGSSILLTSPPFCAIPKQLINYSNSFGVWRRRGVPLADHVVHVASDVRLCVRGPSTNRGSHTESTSC